MYRHTPGTSTVLLITEMVRFVAIKISTLCDTQNNAYTLYVHSNIIRVIRLVVITQVNSHFVTGHQGLPSVHAKLTNTYWDAYTLSWVCYRPHGDKQKMTIFFPCHRSLCCVHVMHHSTNTDAQTHYWNWYDPSDNKIDTFCHGSKILPGVHKAHIFFQCME